MLNFGYLSTHKAWLALFTLKYHQNGTIHYTCTCIEQRNSHAGEDAARRTWICTVMSVHATLRYTANWHNQTQVHKEQAQDWRAWSMSKSSSSVSEWDWASVGKAYSHFCDRPSHALGALNIVYTAPPDSWRCHSNVYVKEDHFVAFRSLNYS